MDIDGQDRRAKVIKAAMEVNRQRAAGDSLRCGFCNFWQKRWEMDVQLRDGVEVFQCSACAHASFLGLESRLELGSAPVEFRA